MTTESTEWTLTEAARLLGEPQRRLIYLCEKGVVHPDVQDAKGRGRSRRFSDRNLYGGLDLREVASSEAGPQDLDRALAQARAPERKRTPSGFGGPEGSCHFSPA